MVKGRTSTKAKSLQSQSIRYDHAKCGRIRADFNQEREFKLALVITPDTRQYADEIMDALWAAFIEEQIRNWREQFEAPFMLRADGSKRKPRPSSEHKEPRYREFTTILGVHPDTIEMRTEGLVTMIKIGNGAANPENPVIHRTEIRISQQFPGRIGFGKIPAPFGRILSRTFKVKSQRVVAAKTESERDKSTLPVMHSMQWKDRNVIIRYEQAKDIGLATSTAGTLRDIVEGEGEVKSIFLMSEYKNRRPVDLKESPGYVGWTEEDVRQLCDAFLLEQQQKFVAFAMEWFLKNGFAGCRLEPVFKSKSYPEIREFHDLVTFGGKAAVKAVRDINLKSPGFVINPILQDIRQKMRDQQLAAQLKNVA